VKHIKQHKLFQPPFINPWRVVLWTADSRPKSRMFTKR